MFGARLRHWRERAGFTQAQLATRLGYHHSYLSKLELGSRRPTAEFACRADELLGTGGELTMLSRPPDGQEPAIPPPLPGLATDPADGTLRSWRARFPVYGIGCPLHGYRGCVADAPPEGPGAAVVHGFAALLAGYSQINLECVTTGITVAVEGCLHAMAEAMRAAAEPVGTALAGLAAHFADLAGWLRVERGQHGLGMAWFQRGVDWGQAAGNVPALCGLYTRMSSVARLEGDGSSAIAFARAARDTDPRRGWVRLHAQLHAARGYALLGDRAEFDRLAARALALAERLDERDQLEAPWLCGAEGQTFVSSFLAGGLRDLAARTGERTCADRAVEFARHSLASVPPRMYPSLVLLTLRLADSRACAGQPEAALATAAPVLPAARRAGMTVISRELAGLRERLGPASTALDSWPPNRDPLPYQR
ncbi:helix-turn-helix domain-containing protein [Crossiella sp. SN42]|uniref:helix-turn-helix domain-containing protein n=1 Tax=Crossiella sp. SN42 TaxID=2944808 RepID=UPI00207D39C8|nr:helix-turn-helix transcriptional regulator [Crossiella sp. SN42]MCO1574344.1 helix-turn-helix domain-containing protein [Crossiella sp. SN42]